MRVRPYREVDVFTSQAYQGNPLAVVVDASGLDTDKMQRFAKWTNLSETSFLLPASDPEADYLVRIFTPTRELPFAGHPTLGSCHAWLAAGGIPRQTDIIVQQCALGLVRLRRTESRLAFAAPPMRQAAVNTVQQQAALAALGLERARLRRAARLDNGPCWLGLLLDSADTVLSLNPDLAALRPLGLVGLIGPRLGPGASTPARTQAAEPSDFEVRAFAVADGIPEDPVTGSLNASLAQWLIAAQLAPPTYVVAQGTRLQRAGRVHIQASDGAVWIGGDCVTCVEGTVVL